MFSVVKSGMDTALHELSVISNNISNAKGCITFFVFLTHAASEIIWR